MPLIYEGMELQANTFEREGRLYEKILTQYRVMPMECRYLSSN